MKPATIHRCCAAAICLFLLITAGCVPSKDYPVIDPERAFDNRPYFSRISPMQYPDFTDDMVYDGLAHSLQQSLLYLDRIPSNRQFDFGRDTYDATHMIRSLVKFLEFTRNKPTDRELREFIESRYYVYRYQTFNFSEDIDYDYLERSVSRSISYLETVPPDRMFRFGQDSFDAGMMLNSLGHFHKFISKKPSRKRFINYIGSHYPVFRYLESGLPVDILFTGYYEPFLKGSLVRSPDYSVPVYAVPNDLTSIDLSQFSDRFKGEKIIGRYIDGPGFVPYFDRRDIDGRNALAGRARAIAWVDDIVDRFFLEIQGSGTIFLDNGRTIKAHYHHSNGRPYRSIGAYLINKGKIPREEMSMQAIRAYLRDHPEEVGHILNYNPSYVFFKIVDDGPLGCINVKLTPGRSIATDRKLFPSGALAFIETKKPLIDSDERIHDWTESSRFVLNQDTGGAIRGPGRVDLFWGNGTYAEIAAGYMQHPGTLYFLVLKPDEEL